MKIKNLLRVSLLGVWLMAMFSSCVRDEDVAYYLAGVWEGTVDEYSVTMEFYQDDVYTSSGTGWEIDRGWYSMSKAPFRWWVKDGDIYIQFDDRSNRRVVMDGNIPLARTDDYMRGYFVDYYTGERLAYYNLRQVYGNSKVDNGRFGAEK